MEHFNKLSPAEHERLSLLLEEMGEAQQAIGKILRHGFESCHPEGEQTNREMLEEELGHVRHAMIRLCDSGDLRKQEIHYYAREKHLKVKRYLHHQS